MYGDGGGGPPSWLIIHYAQSLTRARRSVGRILRCSLIACPPAVRFPLSFLHDPSRISDDHSWSSCVSYLNRLHCCWVVTGYYTHCWPRQSRTRRSFCGKVVTVAWKGNGNRCLQGSPKWSTLGCTVATSRDLRRTFLRNSYIVPYVRCNRASASLSLYAYKL